MPTTPIGFDPTWTSTAVTPYTLGMTVESLGKMYKCVKTTDAVNATNGMVAEWATTAGTNTVTVDRAGGSSLGRVAAGVHVGAVVAGRYCFVQIRGYHAAIKDAAGGVNAVGKKTMPHATTDGDAAPATVYTDDWFAKCLVVSAGGVFGGEVFI